MKAILVFTLLSALVSTAKAESCDKQLTKLGQPTKALKPQNPTEGLISYLSLLLEQRIIGQAELQSFLENLETGKIINPISRARGKVDSASLIHRTEIRDRIRRKASLDIDRLIAWTKISLYRVLRAGEVREKTMHDTLAPYQRMEFHQIPEGIFTFGSEIIKVSAFEMMSTPVTQRQWVDLMGDNPSFFTVGDDSISVTRARNNVEMRPDNPVERVTWWAALYFANTLSEKAGLKPAYSLGPMTVRPQLAASGRVGVGTLVINSPNGNIYETEGFRLPTQREILYLIKSFKRDDLASSIWDPGNSRGSTQPVAQLPPLLFRGLPFYDVLGNVSEWLFDPHPQDANQRLTFGGSYSDYHVFGWNWYQSDSFISSRGFRLVRSMKK